jgi:hypothetical protein
VHYDNGDYARRREFTAGIPDGWSEQDLMDLLSSPMKHPSSSYQVPARAFGSPKLFDSNATPTDPRDLFIRLELLSYELRGATFRVRECWWPTSNGGGRL